MAIIIGYNADAQEVGRLSVSCRGKKSLEARKARKDLRMVGAISFHHFKPPYAEVARAG